MYRIKIRRKKVKKNYTEIFFFLIKIHAKNERIIKIKQEGSETTELKFKLKIVNYEIILDECVCVCVYV